MSRVSRLMNVVLTVLVVVLVLYSYTINRELARANLEIGTLTLQLQNGEKALNDARARVMEAQELVERATQAIEQRLKAYRYTPTKPE